MIRVATFVGLLTFALTTSPSAFAKTKWKRLYAERAEASSYLQNNWNKYTENYHPNYVLDDNPKTAWVEGDEGDGIGASITVGLSDLPNALAVKVDLRNGYQKSKALFSANAVPKKVNLTLLSDMQEIASKSFELKKSRGWQSIVLNIEGSRGFDTLQLTLESTYPGRRYKDTCLSDIRVFVDSDVAYNESAEKAKQKVLKTWIKKRVEDAKFFAKLPRTYPFAGTHFRTKNDKQVAVYKTRTQWNKDGVVPKTFVPIHKQVQAGKYSKHASKHFRPQDLESLEVIEELSKDKGQSASGKVLHVTVKDRVRPPDGLWMENALYVDYLDRDRLTFFEGKGRHVNLLSKLKRKAARVGYDNLGSDGYMLEVGRKWLRGHPTVDRREDKTIQTVYAWEHKIVEERSVYDTLTQCLMSFDNKERLEEIVCRAEDREGVRYQITDIRRTRKGKIDRWTTRRASYANAFSEGGPEMESNGYSAEVSVVKLPAVAKK